ncbi:MAG TPA: hypothetical protein ENJ15_01100 [Caldithrix abyssi]|uniref:Uncharacterized protein n=1 Tax=Caldithrix abyssi TaxID=187145 RepID=A0A7V5RN28_CALAY|nr:hypothetical protein [Caldithrix abyssi]
MSNSNDISQIRNLIFGETIDEINSKFNQIESGIADINARISALEKELSGTQSRGEEKAAVLLEEIRGTRSQMSEQLSTLKKDLLSRIEKMEQSKTNRQALAALFDRMAAELKTDGKK